MIDSVAQPLEPTVCAICGVPGSSDEVYPARLPAGVFSASTFSARREPDRVHYRLVRCQRCGLLRSDPVGSEALHAELYAESAFTYGGQVTALRRTYGRYLARLRVLRPAMTSLLEIGCGSGFFLEEAMAQGIESVHGIEPSTAAIEQASPRAREHIIQGVMGPGILPDASVDAVCMFQVLDHFHDPLAVLRHARAVLKPGGLILSINHDAGSLSAAILGERSPIFDIEHTYLYSKKTIRTLFARAGLQTVTVGAAFNTYPVSYLVHLMPFRPGVKDRLRTVLDRVRLSDVNATVPLGNLFAVGRLGSA